MLVFQVLTHILLGAGSCYANSDQGQYWEDNGLENPKLFQGDIIGIDDAGDRTATNDPTRLWPGGRIPYVLDPKLGSEISLKMLQEAMWIYGNKTCIRFVPRTTENHYVTIFPGPGCFSALGKVKGLDNQLVSLPEGCGHVGKILHELGHTLGFYHEQNRYDRDDHLIIFWKNIMPNMTSQFAKLRPDKIQLLTPFDYDSVMIYGSFTFSKAKWRLATMVTKKGRIIKQTRDKDDLSAMDVIRINKLYNCKM